MKYRVDTSISARTRHTAITIGWIAIAMSLVVLLYTLLRWDTASWWLKIEAPLQILLGGWLIHDNRWQLAHYPHS
ncbi:hypothetical protein C1Y63_08875 [Corynebacterium sp. 13CS0277]|uniref:hypothetical protein n=1 Tax=Corynebacterium sp. 13CS0277 TaxID=2071994 RepID=UPI000D045248|nr:hypothetical protein [Corynebacterium sp. 13CS0277]PRQ10967.1 hypothetical protein C1Y63_08875 [Corynebacterium sp. 13CS0277]